MNQLSTVRETEIAEKGGNQCFFLFFFTVVIKLRRWEELYCSNRFIFALPRRTASSVSTTITFTLPILLLPTKRTKGYHYHYHAHRSLLLPFPFSLPFKFMAFPSRDPLPRSVSGRHEPNRVKGVLAREDPPVGLNQYGVVVCMVREVGSCREEEGKYHYS
ncbi:hypothetical protein TRVL_06837 [Trypanosoma vivax]|uniref:Uncharacterized protein n=1 Tax=Trypanosoma vivax (strain Y486) TaxID=1055687 RepID=G0TYI2_TRYVY|nr:hypothetical protein TRVL_06837 [Trypanosoma vivax]CCC49029.1 hypothetical protein TVY486_0703630 [Trypanosoma vivax Y486]